MASVQDDKFAQAAIAQRLVSKDDIDRCLAELGGSRGGERLHIDDLLVEKGLLSREKADALAKSLGINKAFARIGGFELLEEIGRGGMGTVFKSRQVSMDRLVALKVLPPRLAKNHAYTDRFFKEARAVAKLSHVNIIQGYDVGEASGYYYFAMEYVDGESVATRLAREGTLKESEALGIIEQICKALAHAQAVAHIVHRDIKPENIMLTKSGTAKLADLGLARTVEEKGDIVAGTPHYLSPEQARHSSKADIRSDIYSLGATLFHMVAGTPPFNGPTAEAVIDQHLTKELPSPRDYNASLSLGICKLIAAMMAKDAANRYQTPEELLHDVRLVAQGIPPQRAMKLSTVPAGGARIAARQRRESWVMPVAISIACAALVVIGVVILVSVGGEQQMNGQRPHVVQEPSAIALADAEKFAKENPWQLERIAAEFEKVAKEHAGTPAAASALRKADDARAERDKQAEASFAGVKAKADELAEQERFLQAVAAWKDFPTDFRFGRWNTQAASQVRQLNNKGRARAKQVLAEGDALADKQQYTDAIKRLDSARIFGFEQNTIENRIAQYKKLDQQTQQQRIAAETEKALKEYAALIVTVARLEREQRFDEAIRECDSYLASYKNPPPDAVELRKEVQTASQVWKEAFGGLQRLVGSAIEIRAKGIMLRGKLRKVGDTTFTVETNATMHTHNLSDIDPDQWLMLAGILGDDVYSARRQAMFLIAIGAKEKAEQIIDATGDDNLIREWKARTQKRQAIIDANQDEGLAGKALEEAHSLADRQQWKTLYHKLALLREEYADTMAATKARKTIDGLLAKTGVGLAKEPGLGTIPPDELIRLLDNLRAMAAWQEENRCPRTVPCGTCEGTGYQTEASKCTRCEDGKVTCPRCKGRMVEAAEVGTRLCKQCGGEGKVKCTACAGKGQTQRRLTCPECKGKKSVQCTVCNGTGHKEKMPQKYLDTLRAIEERWKVNQALLQAILKP